MTGFASSRLLAAAALAACRCCDVDDTIETTISVVKSEAPTIIYTQRKTIIQNKNKNNNNNIIK